MGITGAKSVSTAGQEIVVANEIALAAAAGQITGLAPQHKFGRNPAAPNGTEVDIWAQGGTMTWLSTAAQMDVVSDSVNDDGDPTTNTGAHTLTIQGLDSNFDELEETVTLNGTTNVTTTGSFIRINRAFVASGGTYHGFNDGIITIRVTGGGAVQAAIAAGISQTQKTQFTVPNGKTAFWISYDAHVDSTKGGQICFYQYMNGDDVTQPYTGSRRLIFEIPNLSGSHTMSLRAFPSFAAKTDLWWTVNANAASTDVSVSYDLAIQG